ncbi:hypothetical protein [Brevifollis gellanilyticus]|uniref:Uncharacterized protein n=1 Tax=Brevifollis gellanilyticus TaxID=748831 RepID=A0A512MFV7_9BACT|nr:hypothetical protein [Brevifollis gellanilyticus]GEP45622.1 hypothetical protein BGE01nite_49130 [Brevifollis gellanilyticus]
MSHRKHHSIVATSEPEQLESQPAELHVPTAVDEALDNVKTTTKRAMDEVMAYTESHPDRALLYAVTAGYALRVLPVARILGGVVRLAVPLVKPAILYYGITKIIASRRA